MFVHRKSSLLLLILLIAGASRAVARGDSKNEVSQDEAGGSVDTSLPQTFESANGAAVAAETFESAPF